MTDNTNIPANSVLRGFPEPRRSGFEWSASHTRWRNEFIDEWRKGYIDWLASNTDPAVVRRIGELYADSLVGWLQYCLDQFYDGIDEEMGLLRDVLCEDGLIPEGDD